MQSTSQISIIRSINKKTHRLQRDGSRNPRLRVQLHLPGRHIRGPHKRDFIRVLDPRAVDTIVSRVCGDARLGGVEEIRLGGSIRPVNENVRQSQARKALGSVRL